MEQKKNSSMAVASMVLGILSIVLSCCCFMGVGLGALAVIFARLAKVEEKMEGKAVAGMVTGIIGIVLGVVSIFVWALLLANESGSSLYGYLPEIGAMVKGGLL